MIFYFNQISFEAYITVTWLSGGVCTISNGNVSYTAPNTSGSYTFTVEEEGTYTATVTVGSYTFTGNVSITENGQSKTLAVDCSYKIYNNGTENVPISIGVAVDYGGTNGSAKKSSYIYFDNQTSNFGTSHSDYCCFIAKTDQTVQTSKYKSVCCEWSNGGILRPCIGVRGSAFGTPGWTNPVRDFENYSVASRSSSGTLKHDISSITSNKYVAVTFAPGGNVNEGAGKFTSVRLKRIWLE